MAFLGVIVFVFLAWILGNRKNKFPWRIVLTGLSLQFFFGLIILKWPYGRQFFNFLNQVIIKLLSFTTPAQEFIFGGLGSQKIIESFMPAKHSFIFAIQISTSIIFFSALMSTLYYLRIMQKIIGFFAKIIQKTMKISGIEATAAAANIFVGQTEAAIVVRPYLSKMTKSEMMSLMTGGMATVAGGVMAAYIGMGINAIHLLSASVMSAPCAILIAKLLLPEKNDRLLEKNIDVHTEKDVANLFDAISKGATEGLYLSLNIVAMLLAFISLTSLLNGILHWIGGNFGMTNLSLESLLGYLFSPIALLMGIKWDEMTIVGQLLGKKIILNEFVAYIDLLSFKDQLSPRSVIITTYALCGFSNFSSIAIQLGGLSTLVPERRSLIAQLGLRSLIGGTLACLVTACVASILI